MCRNKYKKILVFFNKILFNQFFIHSTNSSFWMINQERIERNYYEDGYRKRAACICVRNRNEDEILLVSSSGTESSWIIPGGGIEKNDLYSEESAEEAALRETFEEGNFLFNKNFNTIIFIISSKLALKE